MTYLQRNETPRQLKAPSHGEGSRSLQVRAIQNKYQNVIDGQPVTPYNLVFLLASLHSQKGLVLSLPFGAYMRGARLLLDTYGPEQAVKMVMLSAHCKNPWSFKYILTLAETESVKVEQSEIGLLIRGMINND